MDEHKKLCFVLTILTVFVLSISSLIVSLKIASYKQELQTLQKAILFLLNDLYGDYLGELQYLSIDPGHDLGSGKRIEYLREQLQQIESFVNTLDPERKAFEK